MSTESVTAIWLFHIRYTPVPDQWSAIWIVRPTDVEPDQSGRVGDGCHTFVRRLEMVRPIYRRVSHLIINQAIAARIATSVATNRTTNAHHHQLG